MVPLPEHGKQLDIIVDMVKVLLRHQGLRFDSYYKTSMDLPEHSGVIPDHFFYIGELPVVGKRRIDWSSDPPPNLAIECDVTKVTKKLGLKPPPSMGTFILGCSIMVMWLGYSTTLKTQSSRDNAP